MQKLVILLLIILSATQSFAADAAARSDEQKTLYAVGLVVGRQLSVFNLTPVELETVKEGLADATSGKTPEVELTAYSDKVQELAKERRKLAGAKLAGVNKDFLEKAAAEKGAIQTASGLVYLSLREGSGPPPGAKDTVVVNYRGTLPDGKEFDSSYKRGKATDLRMDGVIKCWSEGLQKMKTGGKARLVCPATLAYGETGAGEFILPGATLAFEVELLDIKKGMP
ncbi:MAG: FKBP-type peptidyl-prolyl cis-trans isomerase [Geobacteraceae bacterium]|nr:FKBP-type peptidyl-prolyl cis-trans isomerase [Geobacteraceae bacterium]